MNEAAESAPDVASPSATRPKRWAKHAVWLGFVITFVGMVSYFLYFTQFPELRDVPWVSIPIVLLGVVIGAMGSWQVFRYSQGVFRKLLAGTTFLLTLGIAGLFHAYIFYISYQLPAAAEAPAAATAAPSFALLDQTGNTVSLDDYRGRKPVLVFYRGYW